MFGFGKENKEKEVNKELDKFFNELENSIENQHNTGCIGCGVTVDCHEDEDTNNFFCVVGEYPNIKIVEKLYVAEDEYCYCLRNIDSNNLGLYQKDSVFETYEEANNKVIELLQKPHCMCEKKKGK